MPAHRLSAFVPAFIFLLLISTAAFGAGTKTWNGNSSSNMSDGNNWVGNLPPVAGDDLVFGSATNLTVTNDYPAGTSFKSITFSFGGYTVSGNSLNLGGGAFALQNNSGFNTISLDITFENGPPTITVSNSTGVTLGGRVDNGGFLLKCNVGSPSGSVAFSGTVTGTGGLEVDGGNVHISGPGANTYSGTTVVNSGQLGLQKANGVACFNGDLVIGDGSGGANADIVQLLAPNQIPDTSSVTIASSGQLDLFNNNETLNLAGVSTGSIKFGTSAPNILTFNQFSNATFSGVITNVDTNDGIVKTGAGQLLIDSVLSFTATIKVMDGQLKIGSNGGLPISTPIFLESPGALTGSGVVGPVSSGTPSPKGGKLIPGSPTGILQTRDLSLDDNATLYVDLNGDNPGSDYDQISVTGTVTLNNTVLNMTNEFTPSINQEFIIINNDGTDPVTGTFAGLPENSKLDSNGCTFQISYAGGPNFNFVTLTRVRMDTNIALISSQNPVDENVNVTFSASVTAASGIPTGTVQFFVDSIAFGSAVAVDASGNATSTAISYASPGTHIISAGYNGDTLFASSGSTPLTQTVNGQITSSLNVTVPPNAAFSYTITADNSPSSFSASGLPASGNLTLNTLTGDIGGTPTNADLGTYPVMLHAIGSGSTAMATMTLIIDNAPSASGQAVFGTEDTPLPITLSGSDADPQALTYMIVVQPASGKLSGNPPNVTYTPDKDFFGTDHFQFKVNDGVLDSSPAQVDVNISAVNDAPLASADSLSTPMSTPANGTLSASDPDSPSLAFSIVSNGSKGSAVITNASTGAFTYTPLAGVTGDDTFTFKANDGSADSNVATFTIHINPVAPVITSATSATGVAGQAFSYTITANGSTPITYSATVLPGGLFLNGSTIGGTPTQPGTTDVTLTASNGAHPDNTITLSIAIASAQIHITSPASAVGKVGLGFRYEIQADGNGPFTFTAEGLPEGLLFNQSTISGAPKHDGQFTITLGATDTGGQSTSLALQLDIKDKNFNLPPVASEILANPAAPAPNDPVEFSIDAEDPENGTVLVAWNFGDGSNSSGPNVEHVYLSAGVYSVSASVSDGTTTVTKTLSLTVSALDPNAPRITDVTISKNVAHTSDLLTFTAAASDPNNSALTFTWNFGDGSNLVQGASIQHAYAALGSYSVTVTVLNAESLAGRPVTQSVFIVDPTDVPNVAFGGPPIVSPLDGLSVVVEGSSGGVIQLGIDVNSLTRDAYDVSTDFGVPGRASVKGTHPVDKYEKPAIYVATTTARDTTTRETKGKARKTLPVSAAEVHAKSSITAPATNKTIVVSAIKGAFIFGRSGAATQATAKPDTVTLSGTITLPEGLNLSTPQEVHVAVGNVVDKLVLDAKGKATGKFSKLGLKPAKKGSKDAKFSVQMRLANMTGEGFDTEGVTQKPKTNALKIQCALLVGGESYAIETPVQLKVDSKGVKAQISGRGGR